MKRNLLRSIFIFCALLSYGSSFAQTQIIWTDTFRMGIPATAQQISDWNAFRALLVSHPYTKVTMKGTYDQTGQSCTNPTVVAALANSLNVGSDYISPSACNGNVWHNCFVSHGYQGEVWLNPPSACDGANCPGPNGYIIRPGIGTSNPNWGGINTQTCNGVNQRMTLIFEYGTVSVLGYNVTEESFSVYPNPFSNSFNVNLKNINTSELMISNLIGEVVYKQQVSTGTTTVDTEKLNAGIYFVSVKTENGILTKKMIKE